VYWVLLTWSAAYLSLVTSRQFGLDFIGEAFSVAVIFVVIAVVFWKGAVKI
jgi:hypothetical protein